MWRVKYNGLIPAFTVIILQQISSKCKANCTLESYTTWFSAKIIGAIIMKWYQHIWICYNEQWIVLEMHMGDVVRSSGKHTARSTKCIMQTKKFARKAINRCE